MFVFLNDEMGMTPVIASDDDVWRYIQMVSVPDVLYRRWGPKNDRRINSERFYSDHRRMWLKALWWYVYLSWQESSRHPLEETARILDGNGIDSISQIVDRPGIGYNKDLYRAIMRRFSDSPVRSGEMLRKILKLNVVRCSTLEPSLFDSGIDAYVESLFRYYGA